MRPIIVSKDAKHWGRLLGFYGALYLVLVALIAIGYPLAEHFIQPNLSTVVPVNPNNSLIKNLLISSILYWGYVIGSQFVRQSPNNNENSSNE